MSDNQLLQLSAILCIISILFSYRFNKLFAIINLVIYCLFSAFFYYKLFYFGQGGGSLLWWFYLVVLSTFSHPSTAHFSETHDQNGSAN
jgi:hypothetical protein